VSTNQPYLRGDDAERGFINIDWYAQGPPQATTLNIFSDDAGSGLSPIPISNVMWYAQSFPAQATSTLTWTQNSGILPTSNTQAQTLVFQNGQKLEETVQYTFNHLSAPGESEIIVNALTHFAGSNYEVLTVVTS
jgi:hypothetical protein